jgi:hypothetical protein
MPATEVAALTGGIDGIGPPHRVRTRGALAAIKASELRHHDDHQLGATRLACLWVLEHGVQEDYPCDRPRGYGRISQKRRRAKF